MIQLHPVHPLSQVPVLSDGAPLSNLKPIVTTDPSERMGAPTGIPKHLIVMGNILEILNFLKEYHAGQQYLFRIIWKSVEDAIENNADRNGHLNRHSINKILIDHQQQMHQQLTAQNYSIKTNAFIILSIIIKPHQQHHHTGKCTTVGHMLYHMYPIDSPYVIQCHLQQWDGLFWRISKNFKFHVGYNKNQAWLLWLDDIHSHQTHYAITRDG